MILMASACQSNPPQTEASTAIATSSPEAPFKPTPILTIMQQYPFEWSAWKSGPHATGYDLSKGPNTYCSRCHSPANWDSQAVINEPPNCVSCKFQNETEIRIAEGNPLVPESEWKGLECSTCHKIQEGVLVPEPTWYDKQAGFYESVETTSELCEKCHTDTETLRHKRDLGEEIHIGFTCTSCHDPHSMQTSCTQSGCHIIGGGISAVPANHPPMAFASCGQEGCHTGGNFSTKPTQAADGGIVWDHADGHHSAVTCVACHDASDLPVKYLEDQKIWVVFRVTELLGRYSEKTYQSHAITKNVNCARCHYVDNPWGLVEEVGWTIEQ
jgi:hypothetical protein